MAKGKRIVVDASVARSAGSGRTPGDSSSSCREPLAAVLERHRVVLSPAASAEWRRHRSSYARRWLRSMVARRKVDFVDPGTAGELTATLERSPGFSQAECTAMLKDAHLLEAAILTDRVVISRDERVRGLFRRAVASIAEVGRILWGNPEIDTEGVAAWLREGAKSEQRRALGARVA